MRRVVCFAFAMLLFFGTASTKAMGDKEPIPTRQDKVTYDEAVKDHPQLGELVDEKGFNSLDGKEQWELIGMIDKYSFFLHEGQYYAGESPAQSMIYFQKAKSLEKEMGKRFGHVLKK